MENTVYVIYIRHSLGCVSHNFGSSPTAAERTLQDTTNTSTAVDCVHSGGSSEQIQ